MDKHKLVALVSDKLRLLRNEYHLSQDKMSEAIGISKKTLVQIEKERMQASWATAVCVCALFRKSEVLQMTLGDDPVHVVDAVAFQDMMLPQKMTGGGKMFWKTVEQHGKFKIQKNILSHHYRLIDGNGFRWLSSFDKHQVDEHLEVLRRRDDDEEETLA